MTNYDEVRYDRHVKCNNSDLYLNKYYECSFDDVCKSDFYGCRFINCDFTNVNSAVIGLCNFYNCDFINCNFSNGYLFGVRFLDSSFTNVAFCYTNFRKCEFCSVFFDHGCILNGADFVDTTMRLISVRYYGFADLFEKQISLCERKPFIPQNVPEEGSFIAYKKCSALGPGYNDHKNYTIVKLLVPADAKRCSLGHGKIRADKAFVLGINSYPGGEEVLSAWSLFVSPELTVHYKKGEMVYSDTYDENRFIECGEGIHMFLSKEAAMNFNG